MQRILKGDWRKSEVVGVILSQDYFVGDIIIGKGLISATLDEYNRARELLDIVYTQLIHFIYNDPMRLYWKGSNLHHLKSLFGEILYIPWGNKKKFWPQHSWFMSLNELLKDFIALEIIESRYTGYNPKLHTSLKNFAVFWRSKIKNSKNWKSSSTFYVDSSFYRRKKTLISMLKENRYYCQEKKAMSHGCAMNNW